MSAPKVNGWTISYTAIGGIILWSGVTGTKLSTAFKDLLSGQKLTQNEESISGGATLDAAAASGGSGFGGGAPGSNPNASSGSGNANELTVAKYLVLNGYSKAAAAGIASCIEGESAGNPESVGSGGAGLIGWTPPSSAKPFTNIVTGNPSADLNHQMQDIIAYNNAIGSGLIRMLNSISDPVQAADFYSQHFEKPAVTDSDVRPSVAQAIFREL